jgi:hypothetical protein
MGVEVMGSISCGATRVVCVCVCAVLSVLE